MAASPILLVIRDNACPLSLILAAEKFPLETQGRPVFISPSACKPLRKKRILVAQIE